MLPFVPPPAGDAELAVSLSKIALEPADLLHLQLVPSTVALRTCDGEGSSLVSAALLEAGFAEYKYGRVDASTRAIVLNHLMLVAMGMWDMHQWNEQRKPRSFYDMFEKGQISVVLEEQFWCAKADVLYLKSFVISLHVIF
ncbi:hypothetical protein ZWY2020_041033 [Hordeum vulgare]|nr:hypothetical protein ZWY2020_041033 [Hordeum vulgare]